MVLVALWAAGCSSEQAPAGSEFHDPFVGAVQEVRSAAISVIVLPGNGIVRLDEDAEPSDGLERLDCALWASGAVVWSEKSTSGTTRHRHARIPPGTVTALASDLGSLIASVERREYGIPDTSHEQVFVRTGGREFLLLSCHELFESNASTVALSGGVTALDGRMRDEALANEPADFLAFRRTWSAAKDRIRAALPKDGELVDRAKLATLGLR